MMDLARAFNGLDDDESGRVIVLSGLGRALCSYVNLNATEDVFKGDAKDVESHPVVQMERCRKPIIRAIAGLPSPLGFSDCRFSFY